MKEKVRTWFPQGMRNVYNIYIYWVVFISKTNFEQSKTNWNFRRDFLEKKKNENDEKYPTTSWNKSVPEEKLWKFP